MCRRRVNSIKPALIVPELSKKIQLPPKQFKTPPVLPLYSPWCNTAIQKWRGRFASNNLNIYAHYITADWLLFRPSKRSLLERMKMANQLPSSITFRLIHSFHPSHFYYSKPILIASINQLENSPSAYHPRGTFYSTESSEKFFYF